MTSTSSQTVAAPSGRPTDRGRPRFIEATLAPEAWRAAAAHHASRLEPVLEAHEARRASRQKHPVMDFLFEYYSLRPSRLRQWSPGLGVLLTGEGAGAFLEQRGFAACAEGVYVDPSAFPPHRVRALGWIRDLLARTAERPPHLGCYGLHEWAMVYRAEGVRHDHVPLRLQEAALEAFVESSNIACTHFDAFRFFTEAARPLNRLQPTRDGAPAMEQPGCVHANMDLYKWAYKLRPWIDASLIADAFELACRARELDMRASPYDLRRWGLTPIEIETEAGKAEYRELQRQVFEAADPIRQAVIAAYDRLMALLR